MNREALEGATFRKANGCSDKSCVEVALTEGIVGVRDSKDRGRGPVLAFTESEWASFLAGAKSGEFDLPSRSPGKRPGG
jgi:hypothetical protein